MHLQIIITLPFSFPIVNLNVQMVMAIRHYWRNDWPQILLNCLTSRAKNLTLITSRAKKKSYAIRFRNLQSKFSTHVLVQRCPTHLPLATCGEQPFKYEKWLCAKIYHNKIYLTKIYLIHTFMLKFQTNGPR